MIVFDYQALERKHAGMLHKFASYNIGMEYEDLLQELKLTLWNSALKYKEGSKAKFSTYLFSALRRRVQKLNNQINNVQSRIPPSYISNINESVNEDDNEIFVNSPLFLDDVSSIELLSNAKKSTKLVASLILNDVEKKKWDTFATKQEINSGLDELKSLLERGDN